MPDAPCYVEECIVRARAGENPTVIRRMPSGWPVLADHQWVRGYCILLADPIVSGLNALDPEARAQFLRDMGILGDALMEVTGAYRVNYSILGNTDPVLHAHVVPRYSDEPAKYRSGPVWFYPDEACEDLDLEREAGLMADLRSALDRRLGEAGAV